MVNLKRLGFPRNKLTYIPKEIGELTKLQSLSLGGNQIKRIPKEIGRLINLTNLYVWGTDSQYFQKKFELMAVMFTGKFNQI